MPVHNLQQASDVIDDLEKRLTKIENALQAVQQSGGVVTSDSLQEAIRKAKAA